MVVAFVDFLISFVILAGMMLWYQFLPGWQILLLPVFTLVAFLASLGPGLWITALNVKYRDFRYVIPFIVQFGLYVSPVGFSTSVIPESWRLVYSLNPMVGVIDGFRWCLRHRNSGTVGSPLGELRPSLPPISDLRPPFFDLRISAFRFPLFPQRRGLLGAERYLV